MPKLPYAEFKRMLVDPNVPDSEIGEFLTFDRELAGPFDPRPLPDPTKVEMDAEARFDVGSEENAMRWANRVSRERRHLRFGLRRAAGERLPVLVSEGDSWFQFPFLIEDVVDHLGRDHLVWSLDAAGDTAENMVNRRPEYLHALLARQREGSVAAFLFSAAGNDVIGEDELGVPVLSALLKQHVPGRDAASHIDQAALSQVLQRLEGAYRKVVATVRAQDALTRLPILIHGYDHAIPGGQPGDPRRPRHAAQDEWLGGPMAAKGIRDPGLQRSIVRLLIDALYDMLARVAGDPAVSRVHLVDVRGTLGAVGDWADEIHGTSAGFARIADRFRAALGAAGV